MKEQHNLEKMVEKIRLMRKAAEELKELSGGIQAVERNVDRILSGIKMLEINISDVSGLITDDKVNKNLRVITGQETSGPE